MYNSDQTKKWMRQNNEVTLLAYIDSTDYNHVEKVFHKKGGQINTEGV